MEATGAPGPAAIKHWRAFGPGEWDHVKEGVVGMVLGSLLPVVLFYVSFRSWGFSPAVVVVLAWSAAIFAWHYGRTRGADVFSATTFAFACTKAAAGLVSQNPTLYLAWPSLENLVYGSAFVISAWAGRPILALFAQRLYPIPNETRATRAFQRAFLVTSCAWLAGHGLRGVVRLWLLATLPLELYLVADTVAGWPINVSLMAFTAWYPLRQLRRAGLVTQPTRDLSPIDGVELGVEEAAPGTV
jgi:intracellular septation protein A